MLDNMTSANQKIWWMEQARDALHHLNKSTAKLAWVSHTHHAVFKVNDEGNMFILKLALKQYEKQLYDEYDLLNTLFEEGLNVAHPLAWVEIDDSVGMLTSYLTGISPSADSVSEAQMSLIGQFLAQFHQLDLPRTVVNKALLWDGLLAEDGVYYPAEENLTIFGAEYIEILSQVTDVVKQAMEMLGQGSDEVGVIHGDLLMKNLLIDANQLYALDFEYSSWGYYLYDLAPLLWQLKPQTTYLQLEQALWIGYTSIRPLSAMHRDLLETFIAGRQVASLYWVAENQHNPYIVGKVDKIVAQRTEELAAFLTTGQLKRH